MIGKQNISLALLLFYSYSFPLSLSHTLSLAKYFSNQIPEHDNPPCCHDSRAPCNVLKKENMGVCWGVKRGERKETDTEYLSARLSSVSGNKEP